MSFGKTDYKYYTMKTLREMMDLIESAQTVTEEKSRDYLTPQWPDQRALPKAVAKLLLQYAKQNKKSINRLIKASPFDLIDVIVEVNPEFAEDNLEHLSDNDFNWVFLKATEMIAKSIQQQGVAEDQLEETEVDPVRRIEELFRNK